MAPKHYPDYHHRSQYAAVEGGGTCLVDCKAADGPKVPQKTSQDLKKCAAV